MSRFFVEKGKILKNWHIRFKEIRKKHRLSQAKIGRAIGKDGTQISRYERGLLEKFPDSLYKLLQGTFTDNEINYIENGENNVAGAEIVGDTGVLYNKEDQIVVPYHQEVYASAGGGSESHSKANTSPVTFSRHFLNSFLGIYNFKGLSIINAAGDSMDPTIRSGEMMFVYPMENEDFKDGEVYVIMCSNVLLVKRVTYDPLTKKYTLVSDNGKVDPVTLTIDEANDCRFVGRVVGHLDRV